MPVRPYDLITFDCYGTLIDWDAGIRGAFRDLAGARAVDLDALLAAYHVAEPEVEAGPFRPYREVLAESARRAALSVGWALSAADAARFAAGVPRWPPFPDTNAALEHLHGAGYRLAILSNVDDDLLAGTRAMLTVPFAFTITAQQVGSYKPAPAHFLAARARAADARWLHAAQSHFHDVTPAAALGIPIAWVNRKQEPVRTPAPDLHTGTLGELAAILT